ncbi:hypothetical protein LY90DRAFT_498710 [Neocallimastix californiae]|uniref:Uncharacterized protein n=1 Tax=Neocallimastix californiae TaxID=1754190 RepID=A0A1Y2FUW4_9FUNG|nr:hypothetical protein LY90DRAFT_498710 [Neocallimastix californiae]|eukprot:ORY86485.1 hypothetical protein LY90DRAFT_498710 [Neocallimastix californiae]
MNIKSNYLSLFFIFLLNNIFFNIRIMLCMDKMFLYYDFKLPQVVIILRICVIFDEDNIKEEDLENLWIGNSQDLLNDDIRFSTIYSEPGEKTIALYITKTRFYLNEDNKIESDGLLPASTKKIRITVEPSICKVLL